MSPTVNEEPRYLSTYNRLGNYQIGGAMVFAASVVGSVGVILFILAVLGVITVDDDSANTGAAMAAAFFALCSLLIAVGTAMRFWANRP